jgi:hypothetical protein
MFLLSSGTFEREIKRLEIACKELRTLDHPPEWKWPAADLDSCQAAGF